jgi:LemA protein
MGNRVKNAWSQIDVQLKRRYDLIPNLVEVAKGYLKYERETLESVVKARQIAINANNIKEQINAENLLTQALKSLFLVIENYPELKANQNMIFLSQELTSTENRISFARQYYNDEVMRYNTYIQSFPQSLIAKIFNFKEKEFFEIEEGEREKPSIKF